MDKEQIMIDGVDVSGCKKLHWDIAPFLKKEERPFNQHEWKCGGGFAQTYCHNDKNCLYKQLKRKEQELETICKAFDIEYGYDEETGAIVGRCNKLIEKEKELDEYKQSLDEKNKFLQDLGISAGGELKRIKFYIENLKNKYNEKADECEELISEKDFYLQKIAVLEQECEELKEQLQANQPTGICETCMAKAILQNDKYCKTLEEIGKIVKINCEEICGRKFEDCNDFLCTSKNIFDIINKAKRGRQIMIKDKMQLDIVTAVKIFNYGVDYGQLLMEQERENEEWADAFNCCLVSRKTAMPSMPIERRQVHSDNWKNAKKKSIIDFKELLLKICGEAND